MYYIQSVLCYNLEMHVRGHALAGSLLQLEAAGKGLQNGAAGRLTELSVKTTSWDSAAAEPAEPWWPQMSVWHQVRECEILGCPVTLQKTWNIRNPAC